MCHQAQLVSRKKVDVMVMSQHRAKTLSTLSLATATGEKRLRRAFLVSSAPVVCKSLQVFFFMGLGIHRSHIKI